MAAETVSARTPWFWIWRMLALSCALSVSFVRVSARPPDVASAPNGAFLAEDEAPPLYMLTYDHGGLVLWGRDHFRQHLREAISWLDRYPSFKIGLDNEAYTYDRLAQQSPELIAEIRKYLKQYRGRFGIGTCTYGQPLSVFINDESNIRQIEYALEADRRHLGCAPNVYLMSEHAMHSQMPQILKGFGFHGAIMRTHYMMYGYNPTFDAPVGWWVGIDGSRIPAVPTYVGQGAEFGRTTKDNWILTRYPSDQSRESLQDFREQFARITPLLATRADDAGLRREELVRQYEGVPGFRWLLLEDVFSKLPTPTEPLETAPNDFRVRMPWGYCGNEIWDQCRRAEVAVLTAERLAAIEHLLGGDAHEMELMTAWKDLLIAQHHDIQICGLLEEARTFLPRAIKSADEVRSNALQYVAARMQGGKRAQVTVFNPHSWARTEWVEVPVTLARGVATSLVVRQGSQTVPSALLSADRHSDGSVRDARLAIRADPPPLGFASYALESAEESDAPAPEGITVIRDPLRIRTPFVDVTFDPGGGIRSMQDARTGDSLLKPGIRSGFFAARVDGQDCESRGVWSLRLARDGAPWAHARETGFVGDIPYQFEIVLRGDTPRIDCRATFCFDGQRIGRLSENKRDSRSGFAHEHKLRFKLFPALAARVTSVRDLPFAVAETDDSYVNGNYWTAMTDGRSGVALLNRGAMGSVREADGGFSLPLAFAMYYIWGTRMLNGQFCYEFAVYPFANGWREADLHRRAMEYNFPLAAICTPPGDGQLGHTLQLLDVSSPNVLVSAMLNKHGHTYVRLHEHSGRDASVPLRYLGGSAKLIEVDLAHRGTAALSSPLSFGPWQFRTIRVIPLSPVSRD